MEPKYVLRPFQQEMVDKFTKVGGVLCGDDMGLGKTIEGMELDRAKRIRANTSRHLRTLVVSTLGGTDVWTRHYRMYMPGLKAFTVDPKDRSTFINAVRNGKYDVYICHWDIIRMKPVLDALLSVPNGWFHVIGDEIHRIKNRKAQVTQAFKKIRTVNKLGLSGTPADNKPHDFWSVLNWLYPKDFSSYWRFYKYYVDYETHPRNGYHIVKGVRNVEHLNRTIAPFFIRRRKEEVASDLPDKYYDTRWVDLYPQQRKAYNQMAKKMLAWVGENEDQPVPAPVEVTRLMRLQQFAVSGIEVVKTTKRIRNKHFDPRLPEVNPSLHAEVMSLILAKRWGPARKFNWRVADVPVVVYQMTDPSSKLDYLVDMMKDMDLDANPLVVFTQFRRATTLLAHRLERAKITYGIVTGDSSKASRDQVVEDFQAGSTQVFVGTIGACRESITLTRSSHVVFVDRAWSPSWNRQAEDRLHRIGQENAVQVTDLIAKGTVDLGRHSSYKLKWTWLQQMFGDKVLDYQTHLLEGKAA